MTEALRFLPEVENDILAGYAWYEEKSPGMGEEFLRMCYTSAHDVIHHSLGYPKVYGEFRRRLLRRFPYAMYYRVEDNAIVIFGFFHCARNPRAIFSHLQDRNNLTTP